MRVKITNAWIFPVFVLPSWNSWGHAFFLFVFLPKHKWNDEALLRHEKWHVKQSICTLFVGMVILNLIPKMRFRLEAAAYGESVRVKGPESLEGYAQALASAQYATGHTLEQCRSLISERAKDGWLI